MCTVSHIDHKPLPASLPPSHSPGRQQCPRRSPPFGYVLVRLPCHPTIPLPAPSPASFKTCASAPDLHSPPIHWARPHRPPSSSATPSFLRPLRIQRPDPFHSSPSPSRISSRPLGPLASCQILLFFVPFALASAFAFAFAAHPHSHVRPAPFCSALSLCISRRRNTQLCFGGTLLRRSTQSSTPPDHIRRAVPEKSRLAIVCLSHWPLQVGSSCLFCPRFRSRS